MAGLCNRLFIFPALLGLFCMICLLSLVHSAKAAAILDSAFSRSAVPVKNGLYLAQGVDPRINDFEQTLRELNGKIESLSHKIDQLQNEINILSGKNTLLSSDIASNIIDKLAVSQKKSQEEEIEAAKQFTSEQEKLSIFLKNFFRKNLKTIPHTDTAQELFDMGMGFMEAKKYEDAEAAFMTFPLLYPHDALNEAVIFNLGEVRFELKNYREAADSYLAFYNKYPQSAHQPKNLLKLGSTLSELHERDMACEIFGVISEKYEDIDPTILKAIDVQKKSNKCK